MPATPIMIARNEADSVVRNHKNHSYWGPVLFKALRRELKGRSRQEIASALEDARKEIELRSLRLPFDRIFLLKELNTIREELLG